MGFWNSVNDELKKAAMEGWSAVKESAKIGKLKLQIHNLSKKAEKHFNEIGGIVYDLSKQPWENPLTKPEVLRHIDEIKRIEAETEVLKGEIENIRKKEGEGK